MVKVHGPGKPEKPSPEPVGRLGDHTVKPIKSRNKLLRWISNIFSRFLSIFGKSAPPPPSGAPGPPPSTPEASRDPSLRTPPPSAEASLDPSRGPTPPPSPQVSRAATPPPPKTDWVQLIQQAQNKQYLPFIEACQENSFEGKRAAQSSLEAQKTAILYPEHQNELQKVAEKLEIRQLGDDFNNASQLLHDTIAQKRGALESKREANQASLEKVQGSIDQIDWKIKKQEADKSENTHLISREKRALSLAQEIPKLIESKDKKVKELSEQTRISMQKERLRGEIAALEKEIAAKTTELNQAQRPSAEEKAQSEKSQKIEDSIRKLNEESLSFLQEKSRLELEEGKIGVALRQLDGLQMQIEQASKLNENETQELLSVWALHELVAGAHVRLTDTPKQVWLQFSQRNDLEENFRDYLEGLGLTPADNLHKFIHNLLIIQG